MHPFNGRRPGVPVAPLTVRPPAIFIGTTDKYYRQMDRQLNPIIVQYGAGLITEPEAVAQSCLLHWKNRILMIADFADMADTQSGIRYLKNNSVYLAPEYISTMAFDGLVPFPLSLPLSQHPGVISLTGYGCGADLTDPEVQEILNEHKPS